MIHKKGVSLFRRLLSYVFCLKLPTLFLIAATAVASVAAPVASADDARDLLSRAQQLKQAAIELNSGLFALEQELLHPVNTQVTVLVALDTSALFQLDSIELSINDQPAANYLYNDREIEALNQGGIHRFHVADLPPGEHRLEAYFNGHDQQDQAFRQGKSFLLNKETGPATVQLTIKERSSDGQPGLFIKARK